MPQPQPYTYYHIEKANDDAKSKSIAILLSTNHGDDISIFDWLFFILFTTHMLARTQACILFSFNKDLLRTSLFYSYNVLCVLCPYIHLLSANRINECCCWMVWFGLVVTGTNVSTLLRWMSAKHVQWTQWTDASVHTAHIKDDKVKRASNAKRKGTKRTKENKRINRKWNEDGWKERAVQCSTTHLTTKQNNGHRDEEDKR